MLSKSWSGHPDGRDAAALQSSLFACSARTACLIERLEGRVLMAAGGLTIEIKRGPNLASTAAASAAFRKGADFLESLFSDRITVVVDAEIQPMGARVIGQTTSVQFHYDRGEYNGIRDL